MSPMSGGLLHALLGQFEVFVVQISRNILWLEVTIERANLLKRFGRIAPFLRLIGLDSRLEALL